MRGLEVGFILLDSSFKPLAANREAVRVLAFPTEPARIHRVDTFLSDKLRTSLLVRNGGGPGFVTHFQSGKRHYTCSAFRFDASSTAHGGLVVLLLQRPVQHFIDPSRVSTEYGLTPRERESVEFLVQGLTTKDIAKHMKVSPSTVSAFLRMVMVKMGTNSRSGILSKIVHPSS